MSDERRDGPDRDSEVENAARADDATGTDGDARTDGAARTDDATGADDAPRTGAAATEANDAAWTDGGSAADADERPTVPARRYSSFERGSLSWLLQRVTAGFLVVVLAFHFFLLHFVNHAFEVDFAGSSVRMRELGYSVTMVLFLVTATFHGVNGVYNALINQGLDGRQKTAVKWVLVLAGVALVVQGLRVAVALATG